MARAVSLAELPDDAAADVRAWAKGVRRGRAGSAAAPRAPRRDDEHREQVALFDWIRRHEATVPALRWAFAVPNGGKRGMLTAKKLKAEGVRAGVLDVWLPWCRWDETLSVWWPGLVIEMKAGTNRLTTEQKGWRVHLETQGWRVAVCYSAAEARAALCAYLGVADPEPDTITPEGMR